jgi:uncharacterized membrane protein
MKNTLAREPRWPAFVTMIADACIYLALPDRLSVGPRWLLLGIILVLLVPIVFTYQRGHQNITRALTFIANGALTLALIGSLILLVQGLPQHSYAPGKLLRSASALWITNVLVFALWYWKLDAGGPLERDRIGSARNSSFLFPQMLERGPSEPWSPNFLDYLFLAFNTSTAFSPTDTAVLSRWAKVLVMAQSLISLLIVVLLAARAVNIL